MIKALQILSFAYGLILLSPLSSFALVDRADYPTHWWKEVPREQAKSWEVLPQDAADGEVVLSKRNELGKFSNFADVSFVLDGVCYPTVEAFWQMMKYPETAQDERHAWSFKWRYTRDQVAQMNGYSAKSAGNYANFLMDKNDANWVTYRGEKLIFASDADKAHYNIILKALTEKLRQNPDVQQLLLSTQGLVLKADHGISDKAPIEWHYNKIWMLLREEMLGGSLALTTSEDLSKKTCRPLDIKDITP